MTAFPADYYTPLGYLDNPHHSWVLGQSGVVCARKPLSSGWFWPWRVDPRYVAEVRLALDLDGTLVVPWCDQLPPEWNLTCRYHSKNLIVAELTGLPGSLVLEAFLGGRDLLCWHGRVLAWDSSTTLRLLALARLWSPRKSVGPWQGGIVAARDGGGRGPVLRHYAEGVVLRLCGVPPAVRDAIGACPEETLARLTSESERDHRRWQATAKDEMWVGITVVPESSGEFWIKLGRGVSDQSALRAVGPGPRALRSVASGLMREDRRFWAVAPRLEGDWPAQWRRGWVYDWETLRMCVREPRGIFRGRWDAMQVQMPRVVVAETMLDMLMMSYAAPELARSVILGMFRDAVSPQVPCSREDGSVNMVAADGSECGTSPCWCFPFHCLVSIDLRAGSKRWLRQLYPHLQSYLRWWLAHRTDDEEFAVYKCSWESGQDCSARFGREQANGGELVEHVRPVDLQAGLAFAGRVMAFLASQLGRDGSEWMSMAAHFERKTSELWDGTRYRDYDGRTGRPVMPDGYRDLTFLAPLMCVHMDAGRAASVARELEYFVEHPDGWLEWPSFFFQFCECAWASGREDLLARAIAQTADRVYTHWDRRETQEGLPLPGVSAENWIPAGMEGYGWGATLPLAIIRCLLGIRARWERDLVIEVRPNLPERFLIRGHVYRISPLRFRDVTCAISCEVDRDELVRVVLERLDDRSERFAVRLPTGGVESEVSWGPRQPLRAELAAGSALVLRRPAPA